MDATAVIAILILVGFVLGAAELIRFIAPKILKPIVKRETDWLPFLARAAALIVCTYLLIQLLWWLMVFPTLVAFAWQTRIGTDIVRVLGRDGIDLVAFLLLAPSLWLLLFKGRQIVEVPQTRKSTNLTWLEQKIPYLQVLYGAHKGFVEKQREERQAVTPPPTPKVLISDEEKRNSLISNALLIAGIALLVWAFTFAPPSFSVFGLLVLLYWLGYYQRKIKGPRERREKEARERAEWNQPQAPAGPEQTKQAILQMKLAKQRIEQIFDTKGRDNQYKLLSEAQYALKKASQLDRNASFHDKLFGDVPMTFTFDYLGGELYHCYGLLLLRRAGAEWKAYMDVDQDFSLRQKEKEFRQDQKELHDKAEAEAKRAVEFQPDNTRHLHLLAKIYIAAKKYKEAREVLEKAQKILPDDLDTVALMNELPS